MRSPFPGMDPYLEHPALWPDVHNRLLTAIADELVPLVAPRYFVGVDRRSYAFDVEDLALIGVADVAVGTKGRPGPRPPGPEPDLAGDLAVLDVAVPTIDGPGQNFLEIRDVESGTLVTVIELLSPANKTHPDGRDQYEKKRLGIFESLTHLVEIDLHRGGRPMELAVPVPRSHYRILVSRGNLRPRARLYAFSARVPIPTIRVPLMPDDDSVGLDLNAVLHGLYDRARYDLRLDYGKPPVPPLEGADVAWALERIEAVRPPAEEA